MKVWFVLYDSEESTEIDSVWSSEEAANARKDDLRHDWRDWFVESRELDIATTAPPLPSVPRQRSQREIDLDIALVDTMRPSIEAAIRNENALLRFIR